MALSLTSIIVCSTIAFPHTPIIRKLSRNIHQEVVNYDPIYQSCIEEKFSESSLSSLFLVELPFPTGLCVLNAGLSEDAEFRLNHACVLQHNAVSLVSKHRAVVAELPGCLSSEQCIDTISKSEAYSKESKGWNLNAFSTSSDQFYYPLEEVLGPLSNIHALLTGITLPQIAHAFGLNEDFLRIGQLFIAKYVFAEGRLNGLGMHQDRNPWSFIVSLNEADIDFIGGGTRVGEQVKPNGEKGSVYRPVDAGSCIAFHGKNRHEGVPITGGTRYVLTGFCTYFDPFDETPHDTFMDEYSIESDGSAAGAGIQTGDLLRGIFFRGRSEKKNGGARARDIEKARYDDSNTIGMTMDNAGRDLGRNSQVTHMVCMEGVNLQTIRDGVEEGEEGEDGEDGEEDGGRGDGEGGEDGEDGGGGGGELDEDYSSSSTVTLIIERESSSTVLPHTPTDLVTYAVTNKEEILSTGSCWSLDELLRNSLT